MRAFQSRWWIRAGSFAGICLAMLCLPNCSRNGPRILSRERIAYGEAISMSWKEQILLNMVRLRYGDAPVFLDPSSIISQSGTLYQGDVNINGSSPISPPRAANAFGLIGGGFLGRNIVEDRGTVTYAPLTGERFTRSMLTPVKPQVVVEFAQSGYPIEVVFRVLLISLNGLNNQRSAGELRSEPDPRFIRALKALGQLQKEGTFSTRLEKHDHGEKVVLSIRQVSDSAAAAEMRELLGLEPDATELNVVYGNKARTKNELALLTRSLNDILFEFAAQIEVPEKDVTEGRALPTVKLPQAIEKDWPPLIRIRSSATRPEDALTATCYRNQWFYISDTDITSKRMFSFIMFLITLAESSSGSQVAPIVTVPIK